MSADKDADPNVMIEDGVILISKGLFRLHKRDGAAAAANSAGAVVSTFRAMMLDLARLVERAK